MGLFFKLNPPIRCVELDDEEMNIDGCKELYVGDVDIPSVLDQLSEEHRK